MRVRSLPVAIAALALATSLRAQQMPRYHAIWGSGAGDIWAVGDGGAAKHYNGSAWSDAQLGVNVDLRALWGSSARDVWAVGEQGTILHYNGTAWAKANSGTDRDLVAIAGCGASDVTVVGQSEDERQPPLVLHWNGSAWSPQAVGVPFRAAGAAAACPDVVLAGASYFDPKPEERHSAGVVARRHGGAWAASGWNGQRMTDQTIGGARWTRVAAGGTVVALMGIKDNGDRAIMVQRGGAAWVRVPAPTNLPEGTNLDNATLKVAGDGTVLIIFENGFARWASGAWQMMDPQAQARAASTGMMQSAQAMSAGARPGQRMTQEQVRQAQAASAAMQNQMTSMQEAQARLVAMQFGENPGVWAPTGANFYVATVSGRIVKVTGDVAQILNDAMCAMAGMASLPQCAAH